MTAFTRQILLFLGLVPAMLGLLSGCDDVNALGEPGARQTGKMEISDEVRQLLPKGAQIYYSKHIRKPANDFWSVERLDVDTGHISEIINSDLTNFIELLPQDVSPDGATLLAHARKKGTNDRFLIQIDLQSLKYKYFAKGVYARYSPDGSKVAIYRVENPENRYNLILRVHILSNSGKAIASIPCKGQKCFHPNWNVRDNSIFFIENDDTFIQYDVLTRERISYRSRKFNLGLPQICGDEIQMRAHLASEPKPKISNIVLFSQNFLKPLSSADISGFRCHASNLSLVTMRTKNQHLYIGVFQQHEGNFYRLTPGPSLTTSYIAPVFFLKHK